MARDSAQQLPRFQRRTDADGVAERDFVAAEIPQHLCDVDHRLRLDLALIGAAKDGRNVAAHPHAVGLGARQHRLEPVDQFRNRAIDIGARKTFRRRGKYRDQFGAGGLRGLITLLVRHQHRQFAIRMMADAAQHLGRPHHLRDRLGRHERSDLDRCQPRADQRLDESDPVGDADRRLLVLQPVARADFDDLDAIAHDAAGSISASSTPSPTISPTLHLIFFSTPA